MDKVGKKCRDISFRSEKNQKVICVQSKGVCKNFGIRRYGGKL